MGSLQHVADQDSNVTIGVVMMRGTHLCMQATCCYNLFHRFRGAYHIRGHPLTPGAPHALGLAGMTMNIVQDVNIGSNYQVHDTLNRLCFFVFVYVALHCGERRVRVTA